MDKCCIEGCELEGIYPAGLDFLCEEHTHRDGTKNILGYEGGHAWEEWVKTEDGSLPYTSTNTPYVAWKAFVAGYKAGKKVK